MHLNTNRDGTSGAAVVDLQNCPGFKTTASDNTCHTLATLSDASGNYDEEIMPGRYRLDVTTAPTGTQDAQIVVEGH